MARVIAVAYPHHEDDRVRFSQQGTGRCHPSM